MLASLTLAGAFLLTAAPAPAEAPGREPTHVFVATLVRVDLTHRVVTVAVSAPEAREYDLAVDGGTQLLAQGRTLTLADLPMGEPVLVVCADDERGAHHARVVKVGPRRPAAPGTEVSPGS